ncbi:MAG: asparagine synthase (glutamine-hydrolyzing) [Elusimicrobia bacterium RBG_16_66_12]|nr:MAG: asparagine synthase (glutamine-hydrolyzing) [Elusimicrobia bacterium RBG_16_66_12]
MDRGQFLTMLATLDKRGPDQFGCSVVDNIALGHRRLSIIDLSEAGKQPMYSEDGSVGLVLNGEIYNYQELKKELHDKYRWKSKTDTEVLLHGYEEYGPAIVDRIEGMFAFAVLDMRRKVVTLARDHFGKKPLYYYLDDEIFCFASEMKALLKNAEIKSRVRVDRLSLAKYLFYGYIPSPNTICDKIRKLEPSTVVQFRLPEWRLEAKRSFWKLEDVRVNAGLGEGEILEKSEDLIRKAVKKRLMADVPLGVFLSGGVDSSLVTAYLSQCAPRTRAFNVCYDNHPELDESRHAQTVARKLGVPLHSCHFEDSAAEENFLGILDYMDEPMADAAIVPLYFVSKFAREEITVVLSGDGGDELFGGYEKYRAQKFIETYSSLKPLADLLKPLLPRGGPYYKLLDAFGLDFAARQFIFGGGGFLVEDARELLNQRLPGLGLVFEEAIRYSGAFRQEDVVNKSLYLDCRIQLPDWYLVKGDRATMSASLEMRNPLLDKDLAEFAFSLSGNWKIRGRESKYILKRLAEKCVGRETVYRSKKGFGLPLAAWIRSELRQLFGDHLGIGNDYFDSKYVMRLYEEHMAGRNHMFELLRILNFNFFLRKYELG